MKTNPGDAVNPTFNNGVLMSTGLTKRELFAAMAMQGLCALSDDEYPYMDDAAKVAVGFADDLIKELNERQE